MWALDGCRTLTTWGVLRDGGYLRSEARHSAERIDKAAQVNAKVRKVAVGRRLKHAGCGRHESAFAR